MKLKRATLDLIHVTTVHRALDSRIFYREARTARKAGLSVAVVGPHDTGEVVDGVEIIPLRKSRSRLMRRLFAPFKAMYEIRKLQPRIVHFHDPEFIFAAVILKAVGYRIVWDVHEYYSEVQTAYAKVGVVRTLKRTLISCLVEKGPCALFDRCVFPTKALKRTFGNLPNSIACVNLLPLSEFPDKGLDVKKEYDIIFMGSMSPFRARAFMEMVGMLRESRGGFRAALLGVPESTREWMVSNAPSVEFLNAMTFLPRVPHAQVSGVLRRARIGFNYHPMERRFQVALPVKVYEYMACGIPVVCSRFPELSEQLRDDEMSLVDSDDQADYAAAVNKLLSDSDRLDRMGRKGSEVIRNKLNWETREAPKLVALYNELLNDVD